MNEMKKCKWNKLNCHTLGDMPFHVTSCGKSYQNPYDMDAKKIKFCPYCGCKVKR